MRKIYIKDRGEIREVIIVKEFISPRYHNIKSRKYPEYRKEILCWYCHKPKTIDNFNLDNGKALLHVGCRNIVDAEIRANSGNQAVKMIVNYVRLKLDNESNKAYRLFGATRLTDEELTSIIFSCCTYCGALPNKTYAKCKLAFIGIDRVDSNKGYTIDNCVPCCMICNRAKNDMPLDEFLVWINQLVNHVNNKVS